MIYNTVIPSAKQLFVSIIFPVNGSVSLVSMLDVGDDMMLMKQTAWNKHSWMVESSIKAIELLGVSENNK